MKGNGLPCTGSCKERFPVISCGGRLARRKLLFEWLFLALLEVPREGLPGQKKKTQSISILHPRSHWGCVPVLSVLFTCLPEQLGRWLGSVV